jgi:hypothetical protein
MADNIWHFVVCDTHGNAIGEITNATRRQASFYLHDACNVSFTMDGMDPQADMIDEGFSDLQLYRDTQLMFRGRFGSSQDTLGSPNAGGGGGTDPDSHTVGFSAIDYRGMLGYRLAPDSPWGPWNNWDQGQYAWSLIELTQGLWPGLPMPGGDWGITQGIWTPSTVRTMPVISPGTLIEQAINDVSNMNAGFDWEIDANLKFNIWPVPSEGIFSQLGRGQDVNVQLTYGDNVMSALRSLDTTQYANIIRYAGAGTLVSNQDVVSLGLVTQFGPEGRWMSEQSNTNIADQPSLDAIAIGQLIFMFSMTPSYSLTLTHGWWDPSQIWLGDIVTVNIEHGRLSESFDARVSEIDLYVGDAADEETIVITVGRRMGTLLRRLPTTEKKLEQIAKRA